MQHVLVNPCSNTGKHDRSRLGAFELELTLAFEMSEQATWSEYNYKERETVRVGRVVRTEFRTRDSQKDARPDEA